jgi:hypothetical protein
MTRLEDYLIVALVAFIFAFVLSLAGCVSYVLAQ